MNYAPENANARMMIIKPSVSLDENSKSLA